MHRVDYDQLAHQYDDRYRANEPEGVGRALTELVTEVRPRRVLEVGCGTGHWLQQVSSADEAGSPSIEVWGLDLSVEMLRRARGSGVQALVHGDAIRLPFQARSFDVVYCVNAIHHFAQAEAFVAEACRLLAPGGVLAVVGQDPHQTDQAWYVYEYFAGTRETDLDRFPRWGQVLDWMIAGGLDRLRWRVVERIHDAKRGRAVLDDPFLKKEAVSQLALLSQEAYRAGIERIRAALNRAEERGREAVFACDLTLGMLTGVKPE